MLGDFVYTEEDAAGCGSGAAAAGGGGSGGARGRDGASRGVEKALRRFLALAAITVCGGLVWWLFISPMMMPATVSVFSFPGFDAAAALRHARIGDGATFASVNAAEAQALLAAHPLVESARVAKSFPDRISIHLEPRQAVAVSIARIGGRMQPVYFDRHGVAFRVGGSAAGAAAGAPPPWLPVVSGLHREPLAIYLGARLPEPVLPLFARLGAITDEEPGIWQAISEIGVAWSDSGAFDLVLHPVNTFVRIRMGSDITVEGIFYALLMLDVVGRLGDGAPSEIDARSGIGVLAREGPRVGG